MKERKAQTLFKKRSIKKKKKKDAVYGKRKTPAGKNKTLVEIESSDTTDTENVNTAYLLAR